MKEVEDNSSTFCVRMGKNVSATDLANIDTDPKVLL